MKSTDRVLLFSKNGDVCHNENYTYGEALKYLKEHGYKIAFTGRKFTRDGIYTIVGINKENTIPIEQRRKNGLVNARRLFLK